MPINPAAKGVRTGVYQYALIDGRRCQWSLRNLDDEGYQQKDDERYHCASQVDVCA
jgi:hypothetical protein